MKYASFGTACLLVSLTAIAAEPDTAMQLAQNKAVATSFLETIYNQHQPRKAYEKYASARFHHHAQWSGPGTPEEIVKHNIESSETMVKKFPQQKLEIKQVVADGNLVFVHSYYSNGPGVGEEITNAKKGNQKGPKTGEQVVDIMRIENGKIVEHWEVSQPTTDLGDVY